MIELIQYKYELKRLKKSRRNILKKLRLVQNKTNERGYDDGELSSVAQQEDVITNWINYYQTQYYKQVCEKLIIPMPRKEDEELYYKFDFDDNYGERNILTTLGFHHIISSIRNERKIKREHFGFWFTILTGFIGTLIGLVSVWIK